MTAKESCAMFYHLISIVEFLIFFLVFFAGFRIFQLHSTINLRPDKPEFEEATSKEIREVNLPRKKPSAVLDDYIGDFF
ncbi:MAG: hypothetical protein ACJAWS_002398 [Oleiphilaceae bacterium]|jgi:hypothetical protein